MKILNLINYIISLFGFNKKKLTFGVTKCKVVFLNLDDKIFINQGKIENKYIFKDFRSKIFDNFTWFKGFRNEKTFSVLKKVCASYNTDFEGKKSLKSILSKSELTYVQNLFQNSVWKELESIYPEEYQNWIIPTKRIWFHDIYIRYFVYFLNMIGKEQNYPFLFNFDTIASNTALFGILFFIKNICNNMGLNVLIVAHIPNLPDILEMDIDDFPLDDFGAFCIKYDTFFPKKSEE